MKSELRSIHSGRPLGTFREAVERARAWHWLGEVVRIAGVDQVTELDRNSPRHPLSKGLQVSRRFESIQQDGYDPDRVTAVGRRSLFTHVDKHTPDKAKYERAGVGCNHAFWKLLRARNSRSAQDSEIIQALLRVHGRIRLEYNDVSHGETLGLISEYDVNTAYQWEELGELPYDITAITKHVTFDTLQLLLLLYREAQDLAQDRQAKALKERLQNAALLFADDHRYAGEQLDTWHYLIQTRMLRWDPEFQPSKAALARAREDLLDEWNTRPKRKGKRGPSSPESYTQGRAERRWRRQIWARACRLSFEQSDEPEHLQPPDYIYTRTPIGDWLIEHRELIDKHYNRAVEFLINGDPSNPSGDDDVVRESLPPLIMPESLYRLRARPRMDEQTWHHFGEYLPYDVIPVKAAKDNR